MIKKVAKNNKTSGKVSLPLDWVGLEVEVTLASEKKVIGNKSIEDLIEMVVDKTIDKIHEKEPMNRTEPEKKILEKTPTDLSKNLLNMLACRPNPDFCGTTGDAITDELCLACENPVCKHFYEKKNWCNKENKYVKCNGNLRNCNTIKQGVGEEGGD